MMRNMITLPEFITICLWILSVTVVATGRPVNHYYLGFFRNYLVDDRHIFILLTSAEANEVQYSIEAPSVNYYHNGTISDSDEVILNLSTSIQVTSYYYNKGVYITSDSDKITVIAQSLGARSSESFYALPIVWLINSHKYYAISVPKTTVFDSHYNSSILIVGIEENTVIMLTVTQLAIISVGTTTATTATTTDLIPSRQYSFTINGLQTAYITSLEDLSGTKIISEKPVSVSSGHECANIPYNIAYCNHLVEQIPPTALWGTNHYIVPLDSRTSYTLKILAAHNFTSINIYCNNTREFYNINEGGFVNKTLSMQEYCAITSNKKILVAQFSHGENYFEAIGDPMMILVPSTNQYLNEFDFSTLHNSSFNHYINIIVLAQYYQPHMIYLVAGGVNRSLASQLWVSIQVNSITEAYATKVNVPVGLTKIFHSNPASQLMVIVYGFAQGDGYGHIGGFYIPRGPDVPGNFRATVLSSNVVEVTWDRSLSSSVTGYYISYTTTAFYTSGGSVRVNGGSTTSHILNNLEENTPYTITIQATTNSRMSLKSAKILVTTLTDVPSSSPRNVIVTKVIPASLMISWQPPFEIHHNGLLTGYMIKYTRDDIPIVRESFTRETSFLATGLTAFVNYLVSVAAVNINGTGQFSDPVVQVSGENRPETAPHSLSTLAVQSTYVILSWMAPVTPNGIIIQYEVQYRKYNETSLKNFNISTTIMGSVLTGRVEHVFPLTIIYILQLRAYTIAGPGPYSDSLILPEFSDPVQNVTTTFLSSSTLTLTWSEPVIPHGVNILHYTVFYFPLSGPYDSIFTGSKKRLDGGDEELVLNFTINTGTLPNLNGSVTYSIQVSAIYVTLHSGLMLTGNRSAEVIATTAEGVASLPRDLTAQYINSSSIFLQWHRPNPPNGLIKNYTVLFYHKEVNNNNDGESTMITVDVACELTSSVNIVDLVPNTEYYISVIAYTSVGSGAVANLSEATSSDNYSHNDENNTGILGALGALIVILLVGLIVSIVINIWLYLKNKRIMNHTMVMYTKHEGSSKYKEATVGSLHGAKCNTYENITKDAINNNATMDNGIKKESDNNEPLYDLVQVSTDKKPNDDDIIIDVNPSYNISNPVKVSDNIHKVEGPNTHGVTHNMNQKSNVRKMVKPYHEVKSPINEND